MKIVVAALVALLARAPRADAGSCGGDSGGSSDSSSSSSSDSGSSSSDSRPSCVEESDVHGRQVCGGFATWETPRFLPTMSLESGISVRAVSLARYGFSGEVDHGDDGAYTYRLVGEDMDSTAALITADMRILGGRRIYFGGELGLGGVAADENDMTMTTSGNDGVRPAEASSHVQMSFLYGAVLGVRVPLRKLRLSAELFAGGRTLQLAVDSAVGACETTDYSYASRGAIEPRVRVEAWVSPWMTLGLFAGTDLNASETRAMGAFLTGHTRAFDGGR